MRCIACNALLSDYESTRKSQTTGEYLDLCNHCLLYMEREDLATKETPSDEDHHDFIEWKDL